MKTFEQIKDEGNICNYAKVEIKGIKMLAGEIYDRNQKIYFTLGDNEDGWEHVAIHVGNGKKTPSWEVMCKAKAVFWGDEEEVVQIHPKKSAYFHGIEGANMEVLHLWRPKNGDWTLMDKR